MLVWQPTEIAEVPKIKINRNINNLIKITKAYYTITKMYKKI